jgi:hypothetical protein
MVSFLEFLIRLYPNANSGDKGMGLTTDPNDPLLSHGVDEGPVEQAERYLILSEEEREKGFIRPLRRSYIHVGPPGPKYHLRDLDTEQRERYGPEVYVKYEVYPEGEGALGKFWTQKQLDKVGIGCGVETHMGLALCETYARQPSFYGATYCVGCRMHLPVNEFVWAEDGQVVGS